LYVRLRGDFYLMSVGGASLRHLGGTEPDRSLRADVNDLTFFFELKQNGACGLGALRLQTAAARG
jgi:hypothetical protein